MEGLRVRAIDAENGHFVNLNSPEEYERVR